MFKKLFLVLFSISLCTAPEIQPCDCKPQINNQWSTKKKVLVWGLVGTGVVVAAPFILPAGTLAALSTAVAAIKAGAVAATTKTAVIIIPSPVGGVNAGITLARITRPCVIQTTKEARDRLLRAKEHKASKAKTELVDCLKHNKINSPKNDSGLPTACEQAALFYAFIAGTRELNKRTEAFNNGECFCA